MRFAGKVAVVTGAGQGIGETYARRLAGEGAAVVVADINEAQGRRVADAITSDGGKALFVPVDIGEMPSCDAMAAAVREAFGGCDYLVNNAAIFANMRYESLLTVDLDYYFKVMKVNMHGALLASRAIVPMMIERGGGAIVNQSSTAAYAISPNGPYYGISKLAVNGLTMALSAELGPKNIRVNGVAPGPTSTEALSRVPGDVVARIVAQMPLGRLGETDEMADAVLFLLLDQASFITGQTLCVDGGMIRRP